MREFAFAASAFSQAEDACTALLQAVRIAEKAVFQPAAVTSQARGVSLEVDSGPANMENFSRQCWRASRALSSGIEAYFPQGFRKLPMRLPIRLVGQHRRWMVLCKSPT